MDRWFGVLSVVLALTCGAALLPDRQVEAAEGNMSFVVAQNGRLSRFSEQAMENIVSTPEIEYVCFQQIISRGGVDAKSRQYADRLAQAGKKLVLQIWWGPAGDFPWAKYSFANIALDESIGEDFFEEVVDRTIEGLGVENIYGVHLLEEVGMQFAVDVEDRDDPDDFENFKDSNTCYSPLRPFWNGWSLSRGAKYGGMDIPNVRRHEDDFKRIVGFGFKDEVPKGTPRQFLFDRWVSQRLQAQAEIEFCKYIHAKYPGMKAFTWDIPYYSPGNPRTDFNTLGKHVDGIMVNPYSSVIQNFASQRFLRNICPDKEVLCFAWGGRGEGAETMSLDTKVAQFTGAYLAGLNGWGLWTEIMPDFGAAGGRTWEDYLILAKGMSKLPQFEKKSKVLLITGDTQDIYGSVWALTGLKYYDVCPIWEAHAFKLKEYEVVILYVNDFGGDPEVLYDAGAIKTKYGLEGYLYHKQFDSFVEEGGVLILAGKIAINKHAPLFISREGYLHTGEPADYRYVSDFKIEPAGWWKNTLGLRKTYSFSVNRLNCAVDDSAVKQGNAGYFFEHGKGCVYFAPFNRYYTPEEPYGTPAWHEYRQFMTDVIRQVLILRGKEDVAEEYLDSAGTGNNYMEAVHDKYPVRAAVQYLGNYGHLTTLRLKGHDVLRGDEDPTLGEERSAAIVTY